MSLDQAGQSIPKRCGGWAELMGAYRLLSNDAVDPHQMQRPHRDLTRQVCVDQGVILAVSDITDLDFTGRVNITGLGKLGNGQGRGLQQHTMLAVAPEGGVLGILDQRWYARPEAPPGETLRQRQSRWCESDVWSDSIRTAGSSPDGCRYVHVMDRGADCFMTIRTCFAEGVGFLIRACHDRKLHDDPMRLWAHMEAQPALTTMEVKVSAQRTGPKRNQRIARTATVTLRVGAATIPPPTNDPRHAGASLCEVGVVYAHEEHPPEGEKIEPVQWMLLTDEQPETADDALRLTRWYSRRWVVEEFHRVEKEGCRLETTQLDHADDIMRLASVTGVVAVRLLQLRDLAAEASEQREDPVALHRMVGPEWIAVVAALTRTDPATMTPRAFWHAIAGRGGWLGRKHDPPPGWKCIWRGWYDINLMVMGAMLANAARSSPGHE